uniref:Putative secreted protein n=1 Tax=Panstrongylus lignarius TaxID=156445 RepID=A0A224XYG7_9HEMI
MKAFCILLFVIHCVLCRPNSKAGKFIQGYIVTPPSLPTTIRRQNLVYPGSQNDHATLNDLASLAVWNPLDTNGFGRSMYPGQFGYPPIPYFLYSTPPHPMFLSLSPVDAGTSLPSLEAPVLKLISYPSFGNGIGQPSLIPPETTGQLFNGYYIPVIATTTVQTEEVM